MFCRCEVRGIRILEEEGEEKVDFMVIRFFSSLPSAPPLGNDVQSILINQIFESFFICLSTQHFVAFFNLKALENERKNFL